jgi:glycosyltransferase involved in cell wall biosynthesis
VNLVESLKYKYDFYIYTSDTDFGETTPLQGIQPDNWINLNGIQICYHSKGKMTFSKVKSVIKEVNPDRIYLNSMFSNMIKPILAGYQSGKIIIAPRGMLSTSALAVKPIRKFMYLWFLRTFGFAKYLTFHATSNEEEKDIRRIFPNAKCISIAKNVPEPIPIDLKKNEKQVAQARLIFTGRMHPIKNLHLALEALKDLKGDIELTVIATKEDEAYLNKCQQIANSLGQNIKVYWLLNSPHDEIKSHLEQAHFFVLLSEVESFGHAIFEALAVGCPLLISNQTPWKNLQEQKAGWDLSISNSQQIKTTLQEIVNMDNLVWQSYRVGAKNLAENYVKQLNVDKEYSILFENRINFDPLNDHDNQPSTL